MSQLKKAIGLDQQRRADVIRAWLAWGNALGLTEEQSKILLVMNDQNLEAGRTDNPLPPGFYFYRKRDGSTILREHVFIGVQRILEQSMSEQMATCPECGSSEIATTAWVEINTGLPTSDEPPGGYDWCNACSGELGHKDYVYVPRRFAESEEPEEP